MSTKPVLSENPTNEELNEALRWGIETLRKHRQTHVEWRDWLRRHPDDLSIATVGDADFHNETVQTYNTVLAVLEMMLETPAEDVPARPAATENP